MTHKKHIAGFTLLEMLLVLLIATTIMAMLLTYTTQTSAEARRTRIVTQMQQILNAALNYYTQKGTWPTAATVDSTNQLISGFYLQKGMGTNGAWLNPQGNAYITLIDSTNNFYVLSKANGSQTNAADASIIAGLVPSGVTLTSASTPSVPITTPAACSTTSNSCYVVSSVGPPGSNLANARSVNFAGQYHNGGCVPAPTCPTGMSPRVIVAVQGASGVSYSPGSTTYPITSMIAYAVGGAGATNQNAPDIYSNVGSCLGLGAAGTATACTGGSLGGYIDTSGATKYWRVCLQLYTTNGMVSSTNPAWGQYATIVAFTRCVPGSPGSENEPYGSDFSVYTQ